MLVKKIQISKYHQSIDRHIKISETGMSDCKKGNGRPKNMRTHENIEGVIASKDKQSWAHIYHKVRQQKHLGVSPSRIQRIIKNDSHLKALN